MNCCKYILFGSTYRYRFGKEEVLREVASESLKSSCFVQEVLSHQSWHSSGAIDSRQGGAQVDASMEGAEIDLQKHNDKKLDSINDSQCMLQLYGFFF